MCSACPVPLCGLAILHLHLHDIDIDVVDKLHSLTNRGLGLGIKSLASAVGLGLGIKSLALALGVKSLALTIKSLITTLEIVGIGFRYEDTSLNP